VGPGSSNLVVVREAGILVVVMPDPHADGVAARPSRQHDPAHLPRRGGRTRKFRSEWAREGSITWNDEGKEGLEMHARA
jgi:hypothetical protein